MLLTQDLKFLLIEYIINPAIKIKDGFNFKNKRGLSDDIKWNYLSENTKASYLVENILFKNKIKDYKIALWSISANPSFTYLLKKYPEKINWKALSSNSSSEAIELLRKNFNKIDYNYLAENHSPEAFDIFLKANLDYSKYDYIYMCLSYNTDPRAIDLVEKYINLNNYKHHEKTCIWANLSYNYSAIHIIEKNILDSDLASNSNIDWSYLSRNPHPIALKLLEQNPSKIVWSRLAKNLNPKAIYMYCDHFNNKYELFDWYNLSKNPSAIHLLEKYSSYVDKSSIYKILTFLYLINPKLNN